MFDALISMGGLSLLYSTSTPSWGTSLNVLFFYLTWTTLLLSHPPLKVELIGTLVVRVIFFWLPALVFLLFDSGLPKLSKNLKLQGHHAVSAGWEKKLKILGWALVNMLLGIMLQIGLEAFSMHVLRRGTLLRIATTLPLPAELVWDVLRGILLREAAQYYIHRFILHSEWRHSYLTHAHRSWQHDISAPWSVVAHYDNPATYILARAIPVYLPAVLFKFHLLTWFLYLAVVSVEEVTTFSGFSTVYSMLGGATQRMDKHFESSGGGNFSAWGVMDWLHATRVGETAAVQEEEEADKKSSRSRSPSSLASRFSRRSKRH